MIRLNMRLIGVIVGFGSILLGQPARLLSPGEISEIEARVASGRASREEQKNLGRNYGFAILGVTELNRYGTPSKVDSSLRGGPAATHARAALSSSARGAVVGTGGQILWYSVLPCCETASTENRNFGELLLNRAIDLEPDQQEWRALRIGITALRAQGLRAQLSPREALAQMEADLAFLDGDGRASSLDQVAKMAVHAKDLDRAETLARELLAAIAGRERRWYYGNGVFYGNMVLGQVALRRNDTAAAKSYLLASGRTPGSPQLNSFGPSMALAKELLDAGQRDTVLEFLELCKAFWSSPRRGIDRWIAELKAGLEPDFRANLNY